MRRVLSLISRPSLNRSNLLLPPILRPLPKFFTEPKPPAECDSYSATERISLCVYWETFALVGGLGRHAQCRQQVSGEENT